MLALTRECAQKARKGTKNIALTQVFYRKLKPITIKSRIRRYFYCSNTIFFVSLQKNTTKKTIC